MLIFLFKLEKSQDSVNENEVLILPNIWTYQLQISPQTYLNK